MLIGDMQHQQSAIIHYAINQHVQDECKSDNMIEIPSSLMIIHLQIKQQHHDMVANTINRQSQDEFKTNNLERVMSPPETTHPQLK